MFVLFVVKVQINNNNVLFFEGGPYLVLILPQRILSDILLAFCTAAML